MAPVPAPDADQLALPPYGVRYPKPGYKANKLPNAFEDIAEDITTVLTEFGIPPVVSSHEVVAANAAARDAHWGSPASAAARRALQDLGATTVRLDLGWTEQYFAGLTDGGANPGGAITAGWYPVLGALPFGSLKRSTSALSVANNTVVNLTDLTSDIAQGVTASTAGQLTIVQPGQYEIGGAIYWDANATGARQMFINRNSTTFSTNPLVLASSGGFSGSPVGIQARRFVNLAAGDTLRIWAYQTSGGALAVLGTAGAADTPGTYLFARYLGPARA